MEEDNDFILNLVSEPPKCLTTSKIKLKEEKDVPPSLTFPEKQLARNKVNKRSVEPPRKYAPKQTLSENLRGSSLFKSNPVASPLIVITQKPVFEPLFSNKTFEDIDLHPHLVSCLKARLDITRLTAVQEQAIPPILEGRDALVKSCTGSGKTLAYAVPIMQRLQHISPKIQRSDGVYALIIVPTRELALQCYNTFSTLNKAFTWVVPGYLVGGEKKKSEKARLRKGINVLICTPGRLLDHLDHTACLSLEKIKCLVIDEADRLLEEGFESSVKKVLFKCNSDKQSVLVSATLTEAVKDLASISLVDPACINISAGKETPEFGDMTVPKNLKQFTVIVPSKLRLMILSGFIVDNCLKGGFKCLIFLSSQNSVEFHHNLLTGVLLPLLHAKNQRCEIFQLHGKMKQEDRTEVFNEFNSVDEGVLLCTDVAARGLDILHVDWIVQYAAPCSPEIYVHRVGRTARIGKKGSSLLFLLPSENKYTGLLSQHKIYNQELPSEKYLQSLLYLSDVLVKKRAKVTAEECATALQLKYETEVLEEDVLHASAIEAFGSYVQSYTSYPRSMIKYLPFKELHLGHVAKSFCLRETPSELGNLLPKIDKFLSRKPKRNFEESRTNPVKRKFQKTVSEFDSGLSSIRFDTLKKSKNKKLKRRR